jgi:hypothetical protein
VNDARGRTNCLVSAGYLADMPGRLPAGRHAQQLQSTIDTDYSRVGLYPPIVAWHLAVLTPDDEIRVRAEDPH